MGRMTDFMRPGSGLLPKPATVPRRRRISVTVEGLRIRTQGDKDGISLRAAERGNLNAKGFVITFVNPADHVQKNDARMRRDGAFPTGNVLDIFRGEDRFGLGLDPRVSVRGRPEIKLNHLEFADRLPCFAAGLGDDILRGSQDRSGFGIRQGKGSGMADNRQFKHRRRWRGCGKFCRRCPDNNYENERVLKQFHLDNFGAMAGLG